MSAPLRLAAAGVFLFGALALASGCAWRSTQGERYFGPVRYRSIQPPVGRAVVYQVQRLGFGVDAGTQSGVWVGWSERTVASAVKEAHAQHGLATLARASRAGFDPNRWMWTLGYLGIRRAEPAILVRSVALGIDFSVGAERSGLAAGYVEHTKIWPPPDAVTLVEFDAARPLATRALVWPVSPMAEKLAVSEILEEVW